MKSINAHVQETWKKTTLRYIILKLFKTKNKEQNLKSNQEKDKLHRKEQRFRWQISCQKQYKQEDSGEASLKSWQNKTVNLEFYTQQKYLSKNGERCFQIHKSWKNSSPAHCTTKNVRRITLGRRKMKPDENIDLYKGRASEMVNYTWVNMMSSYYFNLFKR